ncbi:MAG: hypothetical protein MJ124_03375 [Lachnospiraceae bacterium]|nr:hypothetical protein [Lachnospiraceae bacterium]
MIGGLQAYGYSPSPYVAGAGMTAMASKMNNGTVNPVSAVPEVFSNDQTERVRKTPSQIEDEREVAMGKMNADTAADKIRKKLGIEKCETCEKRTYVDGSNESDVSFKAPGHIDPDASASVVMAHEREHVANAVQEGNKKDAKLISATVQLKTAICPECGKTYVAGGVTRTQIKHTTDGSDIKKAG